MARVPTVDAPTVSPTNAPLDLRPSPLAFGAGVLGEALGDAGREMERHSDVLAAHALQMQAVDNKAASDLGVVALAQQQGTLLDEFQNSQRGIAAHENLPTAFKALEDQQAAVAASMPNEAAKAQFLSASRINTVNATRTLSSFAARERHDYNVAAVKGAAALLAQQQANDPANFDTYQDQINQQLAVLATPQMEGMSPDEFKAAVAVSTSTNALNVISSLAPKDPTAAQAFLDQHSDSFIPAQKGQAEAIVRSAAEPRMITELVDGMVAGALEGGDTTTAPGGTVTYHLPNAAVTSPFGPRAKPGPGASTDHKGTDYAYALGTQVAAAADGVVTFAGPRGGYGNLVEITHADGSKSRYGHLGQFSVNVGDHITQDTQFALSGATGNATGPNLHFEIIGADGKRVDPQRTRTGGVARTGDPLERLESSVPTLMAQIDANPNLTSTQKDQAQTRLLGQINRLRTAQTIATGAAFDRLQTAAVQGNLDSPEALQNAYPGAMQDWLALPGSSQRNLIRQTTAVANTITPDRQLRINELGGIRDTAPGQFVQMDLTKEDLPLKVIGQLQHQQAQVRAKTEATVQRQTRINSALSNEFVKQGLTDARLQPDTPEYNQFTGALSVELEAWQEAHPKGRITDKELAAISANLLARRAQGKYFGPFEWTSPEGPMAFAVPEDAEARIRAQIEPRTGRPLTEAEVGRYYRMGQRNAR